MNFGGNQFVEQTCNDWFLINNYVLKRQTHLLYQFTINI